MGGLGHQKLPLSEERTGLAISHRPHYPPPPPTMSESGRGAALDSNLRCGCGCQTQVLWPVGAAQSWQEVALLSLSH